MIYSIMRKAILLPDIICSDIIYDSDPGIYRQSRFSEGGNAETGDKKMVFNTGAALLDAIVLAVVSTEEQGTYGYKITQDVRQALDVSESTLYPVLRRLQKEAYLEVYDKEFGGRNRRYYKVTDTGRDKLLEYCREWEEYSTKITKIFTEVEK